MPLTPKERERLARLERRVEHLTAALDNYQGHDAGRVKAERSALRWAIDTIKQCRA